MPRQTLPPVVLIHGMWCTPEVLSPLKQLFEQRGHPVLVPRLPFHYPRTQIGREQRKALQKMGIAEYLEALQKELKKELADLQEAPLIVGHSMGGLLAQLMASRMPCAGLVLLAPASPAGINAWSWSMIRTFGTNLLRFPQWKQLTRLSQANVRYGIANCQPGAVQTRIAEQAVYESGRASWQIGMWFLYRKPTSRVDYAAIRCPVFFAVGEQDRITPRQMGLRNARRLPNCTTHVLPNCCHWLIEGAALAQLSVVLQPWLAQLSSPSSTTPARSVVPCAG